MPIERLQLLEELAGLVDRHTEGDGYRATPIPFLGLARYSAPHYSTLAGPPYGIYNPSIGIAVQVEKAVILGHHRFTFGPSTYLVTSMDLPIILEAMNHSREAPSLSCKIEVSPGLAVELLKYHIDDAIQALSIQLTDEEAKRLEAHYTPRLDQMVINSDPKGIVQSAATVGIHISVPASPK